MANQPITQLPVATQLSGNEVAVLVQNGVTKQTSIQNFANLGGPTGPTGPQGPTGGTGPTSTYEIPLSQFFQLQDNAQANAEDMFRLYLPDFTLKPGEFQMNAGYANGTQWTLSTAGSDTLVTIGAADSGRHDIEIEWRGRSAP